MITTINWWEPSKEEIDIRNLDEVDEGLQNCPIREI